MNTRLLSGVVAGLVGLAGVWTFAHQARAIRALRSDLAQLERPGLRVPPSPDEAPTGRAEAREVRPRAVASPSAEAPAVGLNPEERIELMRLRSQVTDLRARRRALASLTNETPLLQARLAAVSNYARGLLPPGYRRRAEAANVGQSTPEAALETFLWALEHRDSAAFLGLMIPAAQAEMKRQFDNQGAEAAFKSMPSIPGFRIQSRVDRGTDEVEVRLETGPGRPWSLKLVRIDSLWRLAM